MGFSAHSAYLDKRGHGYREDPSCAEDRIVFLHLGEHLIRSSNPVFFLEAPPYLVEPWDNISLQLRGKEMKHQPTVAELTGSHVPESKILSALNPIHC